MAAVIVLETAIEESVTAAETPDADLLETFVRDGNRAAMDQLLSRHTDAAYRVASRFLRNSADAEDAVQMAFIELLKHTTQYRKGASVRAWIMSFVVNTCRNKSREEHRRTARQNEVAKGKATHTDGDLPDRELYQAVLKEIENLPEQYRTALWLHYVEGLTSGDVALTLKHSASTVRSHLARGLEQLRTALATSGVACSVAALPEILVKLPMIETAPATLTASVAGIAAGKLVASTGAGAGTAATATGAAVKSGIVFKAVAGVVLAASVTGGAVMIAKSGGGSAPAPAPAAGPLVETRQDEPGDKEATKGKAGALLGSVDFYPSPERPVGWRGDWTGQFPGATPPTEFSRWAKTPIREMKFQAAKPKNDKEPDNGKLLDTAGNIPEMLYAGPFEVKDGAKPADFQGIPDEANLQPDDGDKAGDLKWTTEKIDAKGLDKAKTFVFYWHTWFYSKTGGNGHVWLVHPPGTRVWHNGKQIYTSDTGRDGNAQMRLPLPIQQGWNRLLYKASSNYFRTWISMQHPVEYETKNVVWMTKMPAHTTSSPILVGDRLFTMSEPSDIVCVNKADGKIRWMKTMTYFDAKPDDEAKPLLDEIAKCNDELVAKINALVSPTGPSTKERNFIADLKKKRYEIERKVGARIKVVDEKEGKKLDAWEQGQPGWACGTPCSDGKNLYCLFMNGVVVCFDLDGKQKWIQKIEFPGNRHHGYSSSPIISKGKFVVTLGPTMRAYDCETGKMEWETPIRQLTWGSLVPVKWGGVDAVLGTEGACAAIADGKELQKTGKFGGSIVVTPVYDAKTDMLYGMTWRGTKTGMAAIVMPATAGAPASEKFWNMPEWDVMKLKADHAGGSVASPLVIDGLYYYISSGAALNVVDVATGKLVYKKLLELEPRVGYVEAPGVAASPAYAGKNIYVVDNSGNILVFQPGREYKQVARNTLQHIPEPGSQYESQEQIWSSPIFEGSRMYLRGDYMFCLGEK